MAKENTSLEDGPAPDPFEAELVAYLDGELDPTTARKVEERLAKDPEARARATELKKSFDLLDYLPRSEPSPTFTTRTLDRLPTVKPTSDSGSGPRELPSGTVHTPAARTGSPRQTSPHGGGGLSTSIPIPLDSDSFPTSATTPGTRRGRSRAFVWVAGVFVAVTAFAAVGYFATAVARPYLFPTQEKEPDEAKGELNPRVVEHLPLYAVADDLGFVTELARSDYFGEDPAVAFDPTLRVPPTEVSNKPAGKDFDALAKTFRALPAARQAEIIKLDEDLHAKEPRERDRLLRVLEAYAAWLDRLPESERRGVLNAATPGLRLGVIRDVRERQWLNSLPAAVRAKPELVQQWREEEAIRRDRWAFIRQHAEEFAANKSPWPFDTEAGRKEVIEFAKTVFKVDDPKRCRLTRDELEEYKSRLDIARRDGAWAWYGLFVYELATQRPYLPESDNSKLMCMDGSDLPPEAVGRLFGKKGGGSQARLRALAGKWPEYPLEVHRELVAATKFGTIPQLGPARVSEFKQPVREFAYKELFSKLTSDEKRDLQRQEGKWPEYPQRFLSYAYKHDLTVPGVTLPGSPKRWEATYGIRFRPRPNR